MLLKEHIVDIEKPDGLCSFAFVVDELPGLFLHPSVFFITHSRSTKIINGALSNLWHWLNSNISHCVKSVRIRSYSVPHFSVFGLNTESYGVSLRIHSKCGKMQTRITPNTDTFHEVFVSSKGIIALQKSLLYSIPFIFIDKRFIFVILWISQGRTQNEYVSSASFNAKKCWPPWLADGENFWF